MNKAPILTKDPRKTKPWVVRWHGSYDPATGKQKRYSKSFRIKADAETFRAEKLKDFQKGGRRDKPEQKTLKAFLDDFLETKKSWKRSTQKVWEFEVKRLLNYFGPDKKLRSIEPTDADKFINAQVKCCPGHKSNGDPLAMFTKQKIKRNVRGIFQKAVEWQLIPSNPFAGLKFKRPPSKRWYRLRPDNYLRLLEAAPNLRTRTLYAVLYTAGLRKSEAMALTWADVDFEQNMLIVDNRQATDTLPPFDVKTYESRKIPLPKQTVDLLIALQLHEQADEGVPYVFLTRERFERVKEKWADCRRTRKPWENRFMVNNVLTGFKRAYRRAGIVPDGAFTLHVLRKNCIQNWADCLPINVTKQLAGHATTDTTLMYYSQVDEYHLNKAVSEIEMLIESGNKTPEVFSTP